MSVLLLILAGSGALTGAIAAFHWYQASRCKFEIVGRMREGGVEQALNDLAQWTFEIKDKLELSNRSNAKAAIWTAVSVGLSALATLIAHLSSH
jgi:hypothetical protein